MACKTTSPLNQINLLLVIHKITHQKVWLLLNTKAENPYFIFLFLELFENLYKPVQHLQTWRLPTNLNLVIKEVVEATFKALKALSTFHCCT